MSSGPSGRSRSSTSELIWRLRSTSLDPLLEGLRRLAFQLTGVGGEILQAVVHLQPLRRRLRTDTRHPGQVVAGLPDQRGQVRIARRRGEVPLLHHLRSHPAQVGDPLPRVEHRHVLGDQLEGVPVAGADQHLEPQGFGPRRQRADHVVGLEPLLLDEGDVEGLEHLLDQVELATELVRRAGPVRLVLGVDLRPEGLPGHVEGDSDVGRRLVAEHVDQHRGEPEDAVGVLTGDGGEVLHREGEEGAVGDRVAVDQQQLGTGLGRHRGDSIHAR